MPFQYNSFIGITYLYAFQSKNNISIFCIVNTIEIRIVNKKYDFLIQLNSKIISAISMQCKYCSIQYSEYEILFFNIIG